MEWKTLLVSSALWLLVSSCTINTVPHDGATDGSVPPVSDAQYICSKMGACFDIDADGCIRELKNEDPVLLDRCARCFMVSTCDDIGAPGVAGTCDEDC